MSSDPTPIKYRYDINGLRAWAVIAVLLFHFGIPGASAGFIGVDIFFVISGYLMTAIVVKAMEAGNFSVWRFYLARVRRIVPALIVLVGVLLALGWFWLPTPGYQGLGTEALSALTFTSNILFWRSAGYFDVAAHEKWLLHTWSLGIEFQFYVLFPIYVILLWKMRPKTSTITWGLVFALAVSLALSIGVSSIKPAASFYLLPTRGWELAVGGLVFLIGRTSEVRLSRFGAQMFWAGILLWAIGFVLIDDTVAWPSGWALFPVLGTAFIILAQKADMPLMSNPVAQWFGDRSYSLYLWHWPLVVALYFVGLQEEWTWIAIAFGLSLLLGHLSYHLVENPTWKYFAKSSSFKQVKALGLAFVVVAVSATGIRLFFFEGRMPETVQIAAAERTNKDPRRAECFESASGEGAPGCIYGNSENVAAILVGDSHASSTINAAAEMADKYNKGVQLLGLSGCAPVEGLKRANSDRCGSFNEWLFTEELPNTEYSDAAIILVSRTSYYTKGPNESEVSAPPAYFDKPLERWGNSTYLEKFENAYIETACNIQSRHQVYLVRPIPEMGINVPDVMIKRALFRKNDTRVKISLDEYRDRQGFVWKIQNKAAEECGVKILNPLPYMCDDDYCYGSHEGRPLYFDDDHLSEYGNKFLVPMFEKVFSGQRGALTATPSA